MKNKQLSDERPRVDEYVEKTDRPAEVEAAQNRRSYPHIKSSLSPSTLPQR